MHIDKYEEAMMNCRFCFMCRHLSTIGQVRCTEDMDRRAMLESMHKFLRDEH